jgi:phosphoenolpyruvate synthase/pyruvate phosphate dikinase
VSVLELGEAPLAEVGGKAFGLAQLLTLGLPVPPAVVVPVSAHGEIDDPLGIAARLGEPLAVRSSGVAEDGERHSAAGQYESLMGVRGPDLAAAVARVYRSGFSERVRAYHGAADAGMAVVIQHEVRASRSGVAFSRSPVPPTDQVLVEAVFGHGEALVSGAANPDRFWVDTRDRVRATLASRIGAYALLRTLRDDEVQAVAAKARQAEAGVGRPVDIEFCFEGSRLWLVQCRSITAMPSSGGAR